MLCENPRTKLELSTTLNPATLLPIENEPITHDCIQTMGQVYSSRPDLQDQPLTHAELYLFMDGSSLMPKGERRAGYSVVTHSEVVEACALPKNTSAQKAELITLLRALPCGTGKVVNIFTDLRYGFLTLHAHGALYRERGLITAGGKDIKNGEEILALLSAVWLPKQVAVVYCRGHQRGLYPIAKGNRYADEIARWATIQGPLYQPEILTPMVQVSLKDIAPHYSSKEEVLAAEVLHARKLL